MFRYGIIADFVGATRLDRGERETLLQEKCARKWSIPYSPRTHISRSTIVRWIQKYHQGGCKLEALTPQDRTDQGHVRAIDEETGLAILQLRQELPKIPVPELNRILHCLCSSPENLTDFFRKAVRRRVNKDRSVVVDKRLFEAPVALIGKRVELLCHEQT
ncbi:MAG TPA: helix-turn-helix domain-containing protein, partial [Desulfobacterales bacterium]|nr:helix-turn-helix domain-containing protein [Desulfobacterales bacterium]